MTVTADELEALFARGDLVRLGIGSRRACYALPGVPGLCVKCYRSEAEVAEGRDAARGDLRPLSPGAVREIRACRFDARRNTCCQEFRYWQALRRRVPAGLMAAFPREMALLLTPSRGWCLVEELMLNADGTPIEKFQAAWKRAAPDGRRTLLGLFDAFEAALVRYRVRFFDPQTTMVQWTAEGPVLRLPDFEPASRVSIPLDRIFPVLAARKVKRRFARYRLANRIGPAFLQMFRPEAGR